MHTISFVNSKKIARIQGNVFPALCVYDSLRDNICLTYHLFDLFNSILTETADNPISKRPVYVCINETAAS